ncbi:L-threonate dehydrogenase [Camellia lanceoleosa]|uniref:L-threonate dehydrogenase n=1 Tax=Camellia lanceoleosa TaxID=1840588 RepID=A0ACC0GJY6_9ERIC|nr:L-threonate dehydrogenase [Camellia lanceoleosa]
MEWLFKNYVPQLLRDNQTKHLLNTFVQNLGIVLDMAKSCTFPLPLLAVAFQQLIASSSHGHGNDGDDTLIKVVLMN